LSESLHGAGSPQAQRIQIGRNMEIDFKMVLAKRLAGIKDEQEVTLARESYLNRIFNIKKHEGDGKGLR
ncbi:MAG: hypothetical protein QXY33_04635, partial [Candidatus Nitrosocaldaceae archaeon]